MTDVAQPEEGRKRQPFTVTRVIWGVLAFQIMLALVLMGEDLIRVIPYIGFPSTQPSFDQPINPGDQTRRYRPADMPLSPASEGNPDRPFHSTGDMPTRLRFERDSTVLTLAGTIAHGDFERFVRF